MNHRIDSFAAFLESPSRFLFFTGKGGVGKTSLACATGLALAERGRRVLLVSTDPASNLDEVLGLKLTAQPQTIPGAPGLDALNINPEAAAQAYRDRIVGPLRGQLPDSVLRSMEEQLSGACTTEIAAFDEFSQLLGDAAATAGYAHVIFDTAPTGHTLRLLALPKAWTGFFTANTSGTSCLGPLAGLEKQRVVYESAMQALTDPARTTVVLVTRPQQAPLREASRTFDELAAIGVTNQKLIINGMFRANGSGDPAATAWENRGSTAMDGAAEFLERLPVFTVRLRPQSLVGLDALRSLVADLPFDDAKAAAALPDWDDLAARLMPPSGLLAKLESGGPGVILTMGKGGVGKTTVAAAIAVALARRGHPVHLSTTDPAAHVHEAMAGDVPGLTVSRIDPAAETEAYVAEVMDQQGAGLDPESRELLLEDLRSPCTAEIAVFRAFARTVAEGTDRFVVLDTAPTGHTLLLLDATEAWHRELGRQSRDDVPESVRELLPRLRDPRFSRVILVTLPENTPVHEAAALQSDLRRAGIEPFAWVINHSLLPVPVTDPLLRERAGHEIACVREVLDKHARLATLLPWTPREPAGADALTALFSD